MNINLQPNITGTNINLVKGATQADLTNAVNNSKLYRDESEAFSIVSENKSIIATNSANSASYSATTASNAANIATTKASEANSSAISASASETVCIAKATIATDNADIVIAQAVIATDKATEANTSANTANTQANIAIAKASEASISASNALTSENNADTSEANALTYRNQAESFANSINPSNLVHISGTETITGNKTFSGTVSGLTKATVGLSNVDNTSDANKPISNEVQTALYLKADKATTLGGYGINDAYTKTSTDLLIDIHSKTAKTTLVDADEFMTADSTSTFSLKKITWASIKTLLANLFIPKVTSTDNAIVRFNGTTGDVQNSDIIIDDAGNILINKPLGGVTMVSMTNGAGNTNLVLPESGTVATTADINSISLSGVTAYHLLSGNLSVDNTVITTGFGLYLYTGNTATLPSINLGMDITSQWGNTADETYGYLIKIKSRSAIGDWTWVNSVRGITKYISSNTTATEGTDANMFTLNTVAGVTTLNIGTSTRTNTNGVTYVVEIHQTTHRKTGTTNQGKTYTEHYNPDTGFTIEGYDGSGLAGHEIPHSLGRKLGFWLNKNLTTASSAWSAQYRENYNMILNDTVNEGNDTAKVYINSTSSVTIGTNNLVNTSANQYIMYGWANSYIDESGKLIGIYEIGVNQGTGVAGNKITTRGKPAWLTSKRLDSTSNWFVHDNQRNNINVLKDSILLQNTSGAEDVTYDYITFNVDGFTYNYSDTTYNASGGQYLYMVVYDNDSGSGKSKYYKATDTANVQINNGIIPLAHGIDSNGSKNSIVVANETITGLTYTEGKNYLYKTDTGYGVKPYKPRYLASELVRTFAGEQPDYYDVESNKWFNCDAGAELIIGTTFSDGLIGNWIGTTGISGLSNSTISVEGNKLKMVNPSAVYGSCHQSIATTIGKEYQLKFTVSSGTLPSWILKVGNSISDDGSILSVPSAIFGTYVYKFIAQSTVTFITFSQSNQSGGYNYFDNISVFATDITPTTEITESRNYMNHIVHADADGGVLYVEELPKIEYKNVIKAEEYLGKNACTAWVNLGGTTTPPTIRDSHNVSAIIRTATGVYDVYFKEDMDNTNYTVSHPTLWSTSSGTVGAYKYLNKVTLNVYSGGSLTSAFSDLSIQIFGGRN